MLPIILALILLATPAFAQDQVKIQVLTNESTPYGEYRDAIYYGSQSEYDTAKANGTHEAEKLKRVANYIHAIENPPAPVVITKEQLLAEKAQLDARVTEITAKVAQIDKQPVVVAEEVKPV